MSPQKTTLSRIVYSVVAGTMCLGACVPVSSTTYPPPLTSDAPTQGYPGPATETAVLTAIPTITVQPTETLEPVTETPETTLTPVPIVDDGVYFPVPWISLEYDTEKWQKRMFVLGQEAGAWVIYPHEPGLVHRVLGGCYIGANNPRDFGPGIEIRGREELIGNHLYSVLELFNETDDGQIPAIVYDSDIAVEWKEEGPQCLAEVKQVLATYTQVRP